MDTETMKEGEFDPACVAEIYDKLVGYNFALRALSALLRTSTLEDFAAQGIAPMHPEPADLEAANLRGGLSGLIDLYLSQQEQILEEYRDKYYESDVALVRQAKNEIMLFDQGAWTTRVAAANSLHKTITNLDIVISRGGALQAEAAALKETCLKYLKRVTGKEPAGSAEKTA